MKNLFKPAVTGVVLALSLFSAFATAGTVAVSPVNALAVTIFAPPGADLPQDKLNEIAKRDVIVFIDSSKSMARSIGPDARYCAETKVPSYALSSEGESRWQWCSEQTDLLGKQLQNTLKDQLKVVVFSESYKEYKNVDLSSVPTFFSGTRPGGVTNATAALRSQLRGYFAARDQKKSDVRPLLVAIITDGSPDDPMSLRQTIIDATKKMHNSAEITITFLQVGVDAKASKYLRELDNDLVGAGNTGTASDSVAHKSGNTIAALNEARYDIVTTKTFDQVNKSGLALALLDAVH
ncbi:MAG: hypothetical protein KGS72_23705 [Cyanobacteria bacterium REEB67]|nr:hypothetical protein [Cyanobacteria bacterium REEB67]